MEKIWSSEFELSEDLVVEGLFQFQAWVRPQEFKPGSLVLLSGAMGMGKTEFVKTWIQSFVKTSDSQAVASPSFAIHHSYQHSSGLIHHFDLFRIQSPAELEGTGFWDLLSGTYRVAFIEWPERVADQDWPLDRLVYAFNFQIGSRSDQRLIQKRIRPPYF